MDAEQLLKDAPLFRGLDGKHLRMLAKMAHERTFTRGEVIFREGDESFGMYIIASGQVEVVQERGGEEKVLETRGPGQVFGEISVLVDHPRIATVRATMPTECFVFSEWSFRDVLYRSPSMMRHLVRRLARWVVNAEDRAAASV
ncbi:MAG: Cyclic nucleotide-binding protein [Chloroflexi bacterium]|nr:Cyclic nucleotide-binding protein [Chloroflexota bacterium]